MGYYHFEETVEIQGLSSKFSEATETIAEMHAALDQVQLARHIECILAISPVCQVLTIVGTVWRSCARTRGNIRRRKALLDEFMHKVSNGGFIASFKLSLIGFSLRFSYYLSFARAKTTIVSSVGKRKSQPMHSSITCR